MIFTIVGRQAAFLVLASAMGRPHPGPGSQPTARLHALFCSSGAMPSLAACFSYALGRTRTTDRHRLGGRHFRGAINGPLVISLGHPSLSLWTPSADREAVTVPPAPLGDGFLSYLHEMGETLPTKCSNARSRAGGAHEAIEENTPVGVAYHRPDRPRPFVAVFCRQQHARTRVIVPGMAPTTRLVAMGFFRTNSQSPANMQQKCCDHGRSFALLTMTRPMFCARQDRRLPRISSRTTAFACVNSDIRDADSGPPGAGAEPGDLQRQHAFQAHPLVNRLNLA